VFSHLGSTDIPFSFYPLKAKYVELMGKDKGYNSSHAYCQVKGWSKKNYETFSNDFGRGFENGMKMHIAKSCIFRNGVMHANIIG
jgi:hypothetical protein